MAEKIVFHSLDNGTIKEERFLYSFYSGFAIVQKQKNIASLHESIASKYPNAKILEVSSKSETELGKKLSAFNLVLDGCCVESIFQSSKVFSNGEQFEFLLGKSGREVKKYMKEHAVGPLKCFRYLGADYPLFPKSAFYDYIYIKALLANKDLCDELIKYDFFTDIEFNEKKSINCQARTCAIFVNLIKNKKIDKVFDSFDDFLSIYDDLKNDQLELLFK